MEDVIHFYGGRYTLSKVVKLFLTTLYTFLKGVLGLLTTSSIFYGRYTFLPDGLYLYFSNFPYFFLVDFITYTHSKLFSE